MANRAHVVFAKIKGRSRDTGEAMPVYSREIATSETLTVSGSTATTTNAVPATENDKVDVVIDITTENDIWVAVGTGTPDPTVNPRWLMKAGTSLSLTAETGDKVSVTAA